MSQKPPENAVDLTDAEEWAERKRTLPPHNLGLERGVLSCILLIGGLPKQAETLAATLEYLVPQDFYADAHCRLIHAILAADADGCPLDLVDGLLQWMEDHGYALEPIGGAAYLAELLQNQSCFPWNLDYHCHILRRLRIQRLAVEVGRALAEAAGGGRVSDWLPRLEAATATLRRLHDASGIDTLTVEAPDGEETEIPPTDGETGPAGT